LGAYRTDGVKGGRSTAYFPFAFDARLVVGGRSEPIRFTWLEDDRPAADFPGGRVEADDFEDLLDLLPGGGVLHVVIPVRVGGADGTLEDAPLALTIERAPDPRGGRLTRYRAELVWRREHHGAEATDGLDEIFEELRRQLWPRGWLRCCAGCRWSRYIGSVGWGELSCLVSGGWEATDELYHCDGYAPRLPRSPVRTRSRRTA